MIFSVLVSMWISGTALGAESKLYVIANPAATLPRPPLSEPMRDVFLKRRRFWMNNVRIVPIERPAGSADRAAFNRLVLGRTELEITEYWIQQRQLSGLAQPIRIEDNETLFEVIENTQGSIGYSLLDPAAVQTLSTKRQLQVKVVSEQ